MKNILFLHSSAELYGSDRSLFNLINNLDEKKFNIFVILPENGPLTRKLESLENVKVIIGDIAVLRRKYLSIRGMLNYFFSLIKSIRFVKKIINKNNIDIVYTNTSVVFCGGIAAKLSRKKSLWHVREIISSKFERFIVSTIVDLFSNIIISNSKATAESFTKKTDKVKIVHNAIDTSEVTNYRTVTLNEEFVIGMAGRINRWKGQKLFVEAAEIVLSNTSKTVTFKIAGDAFEGEEYLVEELKEYIQQKNVQNEVELLGYVSDMDQFYNQIDVFVLPSTQPEPFGLVILEAMARSVPVVATNHGGPTEIIEDKTDGYLVDYSDPQEMAEVLLSLLNDREKAYVIGNNGKVKQNNKFSIKNQVKEIEKILIGID